MFCSGIRFGSLMQCLMLPYLLLIRVRSCTVAVVPSIRHACKGEFWITLTKMTTMIILVRWVKAGLSISLPLIVTIPILDNNPLLKLETIAQLIIHIAIKWSLSFFLYLEMLRCHVLIMYLFTCSPFLRADIKVRSYKPTMVYLDNLISTCLLILTGSSYCNRYFCRVTHKRNSLPELLQG